jgi:hypothetical protein
MASRHERPIPRDRLSYRQIVSRWFAEYTLLESTYLYEVYTDGSQIFINWLGTTLAGQRNMYASEWGEDYLALHRMVPKRWLRHIRNVYNRYGNERNGVYHIGYSRGGGIAAFFGGAGFGSMVVKGLKIKKGARLYQVEPGDAIHYSLYPYARYSMATNSHTNPAYQKFGPRQ